MHKVLFGLFVIAFGFMISSPAYAQNKVGAEKCAKMCHKVEFQSWSETPHAKLGAKGADCETCHGPGSGYMPLSIMKDPAKAKAAGLIARPEKASCSPCHKAGTVTDEMMKKIHAHKPKA
jgi:nitrate/TMAO reductase-like tetraheme cytochrome c subunit